MASVGMGMEEFLGYTAFAPSRPHQEKEKKKGEPKLLSDVNVLG